MIRSDILLSVRQALIPPQFVCNPMICFFSTIAAARALYELCLFSFDPPAKVHPLAGMSGHHLGNERGGKGGRLVQSREN